METILDKIIAKKLAVVEELKQQKAVIQKNPTMARKSFMERLANTDQLAIIAEFKRASPSKGDINIGVDPKEQGLKYAQYGADCMSVLTDGPFFKGSYEDLERVSSAVPIPVLCKDFIIDEIQIDFAKAKGASLVLLIAAALDDEKLNRLSKYAVASGLEVLMEVHNEEELERALQTDCQLIGVNNRDLKTFHVSLEVTERLAPTIKESGRYLVSESGIASQEDINRVVAAGANAILVGETFMKAANLKETLASMKVQI
ncbi:MULTISPECIES: indole-3-glycerol phosphate synthase TrpC [unclassified Niallia]|uniref:indole-3-glycerol phosphate synthase TrpC n=1 Tax=Niallia TaxID=2837506 RepID=UPI001EDB47CA|nr:MULTISPECIES: indole-3-glycerol phosphate synthase TrpC [unclassified Niallia]MCM3030804.1 indole-3-glycerol phosphate synthase TrpC [Niallia sp. MER 6]MDL0436137.1 indole-3-glycerol phosphate synthase TrpC [Niallia sp. SS-2023]UPO86125.1 indole-3-glycerol phosphate synthase TrpC [Niallia sp. Man26]